MAAAVQARLSEGVVRCYIAGDRCAGFGFCHAGETSSDDASQPARALRRAAPFGKIIDELSTWYCFTDKFAEDRARRPARELYGTMLLEHGLTKEALAAFEATLNKEPHRLAPNSAPARPRRNRATPDKARAHYAAAVALTQNADPVRPQIAQARAFVQGGGTR